MRRRLERRGSALLIVLGMMSFILISAVAFSAYMRQSRLPSSYLRRASSSRHLAKAALAEAIDRIDAAIGNNPHPGVGTVRYRYPRLDGDYGPYNTWTEHVFIGTNQNQFVSPDDTVSTLCVEGLAYIPPPLINEARYYSRRTTTAMWQDLGFDSGRYAFCAIDVSDCFDVNRVTAGSGLSGGSAREIPAGRNSSDTGRITFGHSFENANHTGYQVSPSAWDKFIDDYLTDDGRASSSKLPLVSVADLNLAINRTKPGGLTSPFCDYILNGKAFVPGQTGPEAELLRNMAFVTDSLFTQTNRTGQVFDLSNDKDQPFYNFPRDTDNKNDVTVDQLATLHSPFLDRYTSELSLPEVVQLYDYLDYDSIPASLAMPTVERAPMVTGVTLEGQLQIVVTVNEQTKVVNPTTEYKIKNYILQLQGNLTAMAGVVYPFKYNHGTTPSFKAQAAATITFVPAGEAKALRRASAAAPAIFARGDWPNGGQQPPTVKAYNGARGPSVVTMVSSPVPINIPNKVEEEEDAVVPDVMMPFGNMSGLQLATGLPESPVFSAGVCTMRTSQKMTIDPGPPRTETPDGDPVYEFGGFPSRGDLNNFVNLNAPSDEKYVPVVQVWVRILDANNNVVDLVPACAADDERPSALLRSASGSNVRPLLRFLDTESGEPSAIAFNEAALEAYAAKQVTIWPKGYLADDPRFNYAPENFIALNSAGNQLKQEWFDKQRAGNRDGDIFMTVSDAGYLQSIYEFENLLAITGLTGSGDGLGALDGGAYNGAMRVSEQFNGASLAADNAMWRTYSQSSGGSVYADIESIFDDVTSGSKGFRVNPYTSSKGVMLAALANTPIDWWAASTNDAPETGSAKAKQLGTLTEANKYTFSEHSGAQVQLRHDDLEKLADEMIARFRSNQDGDWQTVFDNMGWNEEDRIAGVDLNVPLHTVDKKFLHGFWRECFAARQQLFLIFVRAEPMMMGGGAHGQTPPQLGARAVALVWRDPARTLEDNGASQPRPHRTRVLFYRQFE